jgi:hypothetical protein
MQQLHAYGVEKLPVTGEDGKVAQLQQALRCVR